MGIIRAARPQSNFYVLDKQISEDRRLSWSARGLLIFLLGKPDHWQVSVEALLNCGPDKKGNRKEAIYGYINELISAGYVTRQKHASGAMDYVVSEFPSDTVTEKPDWANPDQANPNLGYPTLVSTEVKQELKKAAKIQLELPGWLPEESWQGFVEMRQKIRKPMTPRAVSMILKKLEGFMQSGQDVAAILDQSVVKSWQDVFPVRQQYQAQQRMGKQEKAQAFMDVLTGRSDSYDANDPFTIDAPATRVA